MLAVAGWGKKSFKQSVNLQSPTGTNVIKKYLYGAREYIEITESVSQRSNFPCVLYRTQHALNHAGYSLSYLNKSRNRANNIINWIYFDSTFIIVLTNILSERTTSTWLAQIKGSSTLTPTQPLSVKRRTTSRSQSQPWDSMLLNIFAPT